MRTAVDTHPELATLAAFRYGELDAEQREAIKAHLAACPTCVLRLASGRFRAIGPQDPNLAAISNSQIPTPLLDHPRYQILDRLGEGGMGVVYLAKHRAMNRTVALKVLSPSPISSNSAAIERFRREVRLAARLSHPNIVQAFDADEAGGLHFLVMEYVEGVSLDRLVHDRGPLSVPLACAIIRQTAFGLQHAFEKGMVHQDIKPHNLMLARAGEVKILDFGLARLAGTETVQPASQTAMAITSPQSLLGTPDFLSPEQARRAAGLDVRSDLYSLGCTLYYLLTGKPPFGGLGFYAKMIAHFKDPAPDISDACPEVPEEVAEIIQKLMAKLPADRFQTPLDLADALLPFAAESLALEENLEDSDRVQLDDPARYDHSASDETRPSYAAALSLKSLPRAEEFQATVSIRGLSSLAVEVSSKAKVPAAREGWERYIKWMALIGLCLALGGVVRWLTQDTGNEPLRPIDGKAEAGRSAQGGGGS